MDLLAAWVLFPLVALLCAAGTGFLAERLNGESLPGTLVVPVGMATLLGITQLTTYFDWTAELTIPLVVAITLAGWALRARRGPVPFRAADRWALASALGVFAVFAAPVVLSGEATFAGYTVLGDTSIHLIGADQMLETGRDFSSLAPSSYGFALHVYYELAGYPAGAPAVAGSLSWLAGGQDVAWTFQPLLSLLVGLMALSLYGLLAPWVASRALRALLVFIGAQPALVLAYALQGSVKEIGTAFALVTLAALLHVYAGQAAAGVRRVLPMALVTAGGVGVVGLVFGLWAGPLVAGAMGAALFAHRSLRWRPIAAQAAVLVGVLAALSYQSLLQLTRYVESNGGVATNQAEFGNLLQPLKAAQVLGIWITGEYRLPPDRLGLSYALIGVAVVSALFGIAWLWRRGAWPLALWLAVSLFAWWFITDRGSPWADGKALAITSPAALTGALLGVVALWDARRRLEGLIVAALVGVGVLASNALAYHDVSLAPRDRLEELASVGERFDGQGPTLYTEFEEFGKHFLRATTPEGSAEGWQPRYQEAGGVQLGLMRDLDSFPQPYVAHYRTIVLRRGSFGSRPPYGYARTWAGRFYDVWQRRGEPGSLVSHAGLGDGREPAGVPACRDVRRLSAAATLEGGRLAFVERGLAPRVSPTTAERPPAWYVDPSDAAVVRTIGPGRLRAEVTAPAARDYGVWLEGSFGREIEVRLDGRRIGAVGYSLNGRRAGELAGRVQLNGSHRLELEREGGDLRPGNGGENRLLGEIVFGPLDPGGLPVRTLPPQRWRELCGRSLDWLAVVRA